MCAEKLMDSFFRNIPPKKSEDRSRSMSCQADTRRESDDNIQNQKKSDRARSWVSDGEQIHIEIREDRHREATDPDRAHIRREDEKCSSGKYRIQDEKETKL